MKLKWDQVGQKKYETGTDRGVLYPQSLSGAYTKGVAWNGLTGVSEAPSGAEPTPLYADNRKYLELMSAEEFAGTITAYTYPDEFEACDGSAEGADGLVITQQERVPFGFSYRTLIGNDTQKTKYGYKIHLVYGALAKPSSKDNKTVNDSPQALEMSWEFSTTPVEITGFQPSAHLVVESTKASPEKLAQLEEILYGKDAVEEDVENGISASPEVDARLPLPDEVISILGTV